MIPEKPKNQLNSYAKYSGLAFQMAVTIAGFVFLGKLADGWFNLKKPILTAIFSTVGIVGSLYMLIRSILQSNKHGQN